MGAEKSSFKLLTIGLMVSLQMVLIGCYRGGNHLIIEAKNNKPNPIPAGDNSKTNCKEQPSDLVTFEEDIKPIFSKYCSQCHSAGPLNWLDYQNLMSKPGRLDAMTNRIFIKGDMPMAGFEKPPQSDLNLIKRWIEAGGPEKKQKSNDPACEENTGSGNSNSGSDSSNTTTTTLPGNSGTDPVNPEDPSQPPTPIEPNPTEPNNPDQPGVPNIPVGPSVMVGYSEDIKPIIDNKCSLCHMNGDMNWTDYSVFSARTTQIRDRVLNKKDMPPLYMNTPLTELELSLFENWINQGAAETRDQARLPADNPNPNPNPNPVPPAPVDPQPEPKPDPQPAPQPQPSNPLDPIYSPIGYEEDAKPIFKEKCSACHKAGYMNWMNYQRAYESTDQMTDRLFVKKDMPPDGNPQLSTEQLRVLKAWLDQGAAETRDKAYPPTPPSKPAQPAEPHLSYRADIVPLLTKYCKDCHSAGDLNWFEYKNLKRVADSGSLKERLIGPRPADKVPMPMPYFPQPSKQELKTFETWISQGAQE